MESAAMSSRKSRAARSLLLYGAPLLVYGMVALKLGLADREVMNGDTVSYVRRAGYLLRGDFYHFISEHFSLMICWLMAPLVAAGIDGLYAARIVTGCIGAAHLVLVIKLSERLLAVHWIWRLLLGLALAPFLAFVAIRAITPDHLLAAWLVGYFIIVLDPALPRSRWRQFAAGIVGGMAYLAKAFALPFVLVHLLLTLLMQARVEAG